MRDSTQVAVLKLLAELAKNPPDQAKTDTALTLYLELVKIIPDFLWLILALIIIKIFYKPIRDQLLPGLTGFKTMGIEFSFVKESITTVIELAKKSPKWEVTIPGEDEQRVLNRVRKHLHIFQDAKIVWIDDIPENNRNEIRMFHQLRAYVDTAKSTEEARQLLESGEYDLIISDMDRHGDPQAGLKFLEENSRKDGRIPVIFYIGTIDPARGVPAKAFGITNRPDELLHLTLDALERKKY